MAIRSRASSLAARPASSARGSSGSGQLAGNGGGDEGLAVFLEEGDLMGEQFGRSCRCVPGVRNSRSADLLVLSTGNGDLKLGEILQPQLLLRATVLPAE